MTEKPSALGALKAHFYQNVQEPYYALMQRGGLRLHTTTDPVLAREVLQRTDDFSTPSFVKKSMGQFIGKALILDDGPSWRKMHDTMADIFSPKGVGNNIAPIAAAETNRMVNRWLGVPGSIIDAEHEMRTLTGRIIMRVIFSDDITPRQSENIIDAAATSLESFRDPSKPTMLARVGYAHRLLHHASKLPHLSFLADVQPDFLGPMKPEYKTALDRISTTLDDVINERRKLDTQPNDILGRLIDYRDADTGQPMPQGQIKDQLVMFIVAGHETTAMALTFALREFLKNPDEEKKLVAEIRGLTKGGDIAAEHHAKLAFTKAAFKETLRLFPTAYEIGREALKDTMVAGRPMKKGDLIRIDIEKMQREPGLWPEPEKFQPERFLKMPFPKQFMAFGGGGHACLGMTMSIVEAGIALAGMYNKVAFEAVAVPTGEINAFTKRADGPLRLRTYTRR